MKSWVETKGPHGVLQGVLPVCTPDGVIKYVRFGWGLSSPLLKVEIEHDPETGVSMIIDARLKSALERVGWATMADLFRADEGEAGPRWRAYLEWLKRTSMLGADPPTRRPFPEKYLPSGVGERRNGAHRALDDEEIVIPESELVKTPSKQKARKAGLEET